MILGGDELGRTQGGNNNAYCQDNEISWYDWSYTDDEFLAWCKRVIALRAEHPVFRRRRWFHGQLIRGVEDLAWLRPDGEEMTDQDWDTGHARAVGVYMNGASLPTTDAYGERIIDDTFLLLFNASDQDLLWTLPSSRWSSRWTVELDTTDPRRGASRAVHARPLEQRPIAARSLVVLRSTRPPSTLVTATPQQPTRPLIVADPASNPIESTGPPDTKGVPSA